MASTNTKTYASNISGQWAAACDVEELHQTLTKALQRATIQQQEILASHTFPVTMCDPLHVYRAFQLLKLGDSLFWNRPAKQHAFVGTGIATSIETHGTRCVAAATSQWRALQQRMVNTTVGRPLSRNHTGPILFGGFAFDPLRPRTPLWQRFADGLLILPSLLFQSYEQGAMLTLNAIVYPGSSIEHFKNAFQHALHRLDTLLARIRMTEEQPELQDTITIQPLISPQQWMKQVEQAIKMIHHGMFQKVVLARGVQLRGEKPFNVGTTLRRLCDSYPSAYVFAIQRGQRYFVGATPERLLCGMDGQIQTMALAGSAPRGNNAEEDQQLGKELLDSAKNQGEHEVVVSTIRQGLSNLCSGVWTADAPRLLKLKNIQHLETPIIGDLLPGRSILEALEYLHPTPAVGGFPRQAALKAIREYEQLDRGWYAGPIGWIGTDGDGEFAVALRSALIEHHQATLFAGCGIVADSQPESELAESNLKLQVMLRALQADCDQLE